MDAAPPPEGTHRPSYGDRLFARRVLIAIGLVALAYFAYLVSGVLVLVFASVLLAVVFHTVAGFFRRWLHMNRRWSLVASVTLLIGIVGALATMFGALIGEQFTAVADALPDAINNLGAYVGVSDAADRVEEALQGSIHATTILPRAAGAGYTLLGAFTNLVLVTVAGIYLASDPDLYKLGVAKLFPRHQHQLVVETMDAVGGALRLWLLGQLVVMVLVGVLSGLGYWWVGLPAPIALGVIAGLTNFIPFLGPFLGAAPAVVFALNESLPILFWTIGVAFVVQQVEGDVITPLIQRRTLSLPPALALFAIVVFGIAFGVVGVLLAVPLTVMAFVAVKKLYVREALGRSTDVPGERQES